MNQATTEFGRFGGAPLVTEMMVVPVAGRDSMLLNLSGAHAPFFTRNLVILKDNAGHTGIGEVPGGERIRQTLLALSDVERSQTYAFCGEAPMPVRDYRATLRVVPVTDGARGFVEWSATFDCVPPAWVARMLLAKLLISILNLNALCSELRI